MKVMYEKPFAYQVLLDQERGEWLIDVLCGGIAMYDVAVKLAPDEILAFQEDPDALGYLADQIAFSPGRFADRTVQLTDRDP